MKDAFLHFFNVMIVCHLFWDLTVGSISQLHIYIDLKLTNTWFSIRPMVR